MDLVFTQQPVIAVQDKFGNLRSAANGNADNSTMVTAARAAGSGALEGTLTARATNGSATFTNLAHNTATNITILFTSGSLTNVTSTSIAVSPAAGQFASTTQPALATKLTGATETVNAPQVTEPLFAGIQVGALKNHSVAVRAEKLLTAGLPLTSLAGVSANSANGGTITLSNGLVTYTPTTNFSGADLFTYIVNDGATSATGSVQVIVADTGTLASNRIGVVVVGTDGAHARFAGIPGFTYNIERSTDGAEWTAIGSVVVPANGLFEFLDTTPPAGSVFYRTASP